jgi:hypothetical protein
MRSCLLDPSLYPSECIDLTETEFLKFCAIRRMPHPPGLVLEIDPLPDAPEETVDEFLNFLLCAAFEHRFGPAQV